MSQKENKIMSKIDSLSKSQKRFIKIAIISIIVVFLSTVGIAIEINQVAIQGEYAPLIIEWTKEAVKHILLAFSFLEILKGLFHLMSPHPDTSIAHICNAILLAAASIAACIYLPNAIIAIGAQTLIMSVCMGIYEHLNNIKYYS